MTRRTKRSGEATLKRTRDQADTDPLPYTQVDRAVKQTAAVIASRLGVTFQHALGGLVQFWELNGDPRDLEKLLNAGEHEVVLPRDEVARRFALAMAPPGQAQLDPDDLATLHLLERKADGSYRIRGMSRYLKPLEGRLQTKAAARAGGKASAAARKAKFGSAQPRSGESGRRSGVRSGSGSAPVRKPLRRRFEAPEGTTVNGQTLLEAAPNTAISGQRSAATTTKSTAPASRTRALSDQIGTIFREVRRADYAFAGGKDGKALQVLLARGSDDEIAARWRRGLELGSKWPGVSTIAQLAARWNDLTAPTSDPRRAPIEATRGSGPIIAREVPLL